MFWGAATAAPFYKEANGLPRYIAKYRQYSHKGVDRVDQETHWQTGKDKHRGIMCDFKHGGLSPWEITAALERFKFGGLGHDEKPERRLSYFDTEIEARLQGWSDEDRAAVEARLSSSPSLGVDFIEVSKPAPALPYAAYAKHRVVQGRRSVEHVVADVQRAVEVAGVDLAAVIEYEREVGGPSPLLSALEALVPSGAQPEDELVPA